MGTYDDDTGKDLDVYTPLQCRTPHSSERLTREIILKDETAERTEYYYLTKIFVKRLVTKTFVNEPLQCMYMCDGEHTL